jgi:hypothetical protein
MKQTRKQNQNLIVTTWPPLTVLTESVLRSEGAHFFFSGSQIGHILFSIVCPLPTPAKLLLCFLWLDAMQISCPKFAVPSVGLKERKQNS